MFDIAWFLLLSWAVLVTCVVPSFVLSCTGYLRGSFFCLELHWLLAWFLLLSWAALVTCVVPSFVLSCTGYLRGSFFHLELHWLLHLRCSWRTTRTGTKEHHLLTLLYHHGDLCTQKPYVQRQCGSGHWTCGSHNLTRQMIIIHFAGELNTRAVCFFGLKFLQLP